MKEAKCGSVVYVNQSKGIKRPDAYVCRRSVIAHLHTIRAFVHTVCTRVYTHTLPLTHTPQGARFTGSDKELKFWIRKKQGAVIFTNSCTSQNSPHLAPNTI